MDDAYCPAIATDLARRATPGVSVSGDNPAASYYGKDGAVWHNSAHLATLGPALPGAHNAQNAAAAMAMARFMGVPDNVAAQAVLSFTGLAHRQKLVETFNGIAFIDDSKATNADASSRALGCYDRLVWIAGGVAKEGGIESLAPYFGRIEHAFLIGRDAPELAATLARHNVPHTVVETLENAVAQAYSLAQQTQTPVILLSPACASFDQYAGFEARGQHFQALAHAVHEQQMSRTGQ